LAWAALSCGTIGVMGRLEQAVERGRAGNVVVLTGAGVSAESGIPTFRGPEGYWTVGSEVYHPQQMATQSAFSRMPDEVWAWYLWRRGVCLDAGPNPAHEAIARLETELGERFVLLTQNVDGLHIRAGNSLGRTYQIHGNIDFMRCASQCCNDLFPIPARFDGFDAEQALTDDDRAALVCPPCGGPTRPHVLWFDECYDEPLFRFESSLRRAAEADLVVSVGTSGATNLPNQVMRLAATTGAAIIDVNSSDNPFAALARSVPVGAAIEQTACAALPDLCARLADRA